MDLRILREAAAAVGVSEDTLTRRIEAGVVPASAVRRGQRVPGRSAVVTLLDVDVVRLALAPPWVRSALEERDAKIRDLESRLDQLLAGRGSAPAAVASGANGEGVVLEGDAILERHGLRARTGQRG